MENLYNYKNKMLFLQNIQYRECEGINISICNPFSYIEDLWDYITEIN